MRPLLAASAGILLLLAGCSQAPAEPAAEIVVHSDGETTVHGDTAELQLGHIQGVVLDAALHPIAGAQVTIPGVSRSVTTRSGGDFILADLQPSSYLLVANATGFRQAHALIEVPSGKIVKVKFLLDPGPPTKPYHETERYDGFMDVTSAPYGLVTFCRCSWEIKVDPLAKSYLFEAVAGQGDTMDAALYDAAGHPSFRDRSASPWQRLVNPANLTPDQRLWVEVSSLVPQVGKPFSVFVTAWYNGEPPAGWTAYQGN